MDINLHGPSNPTQLTQVGDDVFFAADDGVHGVELWKSDGTAAGTTMVEDIREGPKSSYPASLINVNGTLFFLARDGVHGNELWKSDGTEAGTRMVKDLNPYRSGQFCGGGIYVPSGPGYRPVAVGNKLFFFDQCGGLWSGVLYVSDGTAAGTHFVDTPTIAEHEWGDGIGPVADTLSGKLYFVVGGGEWWEGPEEIWVSDGTDSGTHLVAGAPTAGYIAFLPAHGTKLYFVTSASSCEDYCPVPDRLWRTDGTEAGTIPLTDIGELTSMPTQAVLMGDRLYFDVGDALWRTNGTAQGTQPISSGEVRLLTSAVDSIYFIRDSHLWKSDGTTTGTTDVGQFGPYGASHLIGVSAELCFAALVDDDTWALWSSDGTAPGTYQIEAFVVVRSHWGEWDIQQAALGSKLLFAADDGVHGNELWSYTP